MADYRLTDRNQVIRISDSACIPMVDGNADYHDYQVWLAEGNVPDAAVTDSVNPEAVNGERDRRVASGFLFNGVLFQSRVEDQKRINGAGTLAAIAIMQGKQAGDLRWHGGDADFAWIAADNSLVTMDAFTVIAFGKAAAEWEAAHIFAARDIKDMTPIPQGFAADAYWPAAS